MNNEQIKGIMALVAEYWRIAYYEGRSGKSAGDDANETLHNIESALRAAVPEEKDNRYASGESWARAEGWNDCVRHIRASAAQQAAQPVRPSPRMWHDRIKDAHPKSEPEYWPNPLKVEYMEQEILDLRALVAQQAGAVLKQAPQADPFTYIIQHLNSNPYNLTKAECIELIKELRDKYQAS
jgi:hypothetical protein